MLGFNVKPYSLAYIGCKIEKYLFVYLFLSFIRSFIHTIYKLYAWLLEMPSFCALRNSVTQTETEWVYINKPCTLKYFNFNHTFMSSLAYRSLLFLFFRSVLCWGGGGSLLDVSTQINIVRTLQHSIHFAWKICKDCQLVVLRIISFRPLHSMCDVCRRLTCS